MVAFMYIIWLLFVIKIIKLKVSHLKDCQIKVEPAIEMRNLCETGLPRVLYAGPKTIPFIGNREFTLRILVQSDMIPVIIGKLGSTIKTISQQTGAR